MIELNSLSALYIDGKEVEELFIDGKKAYSTLPDAVLEMNMAEYAACSSDTVLSTVTVDNKSYKIYKTFENANWTGSKAKGDRRPWMMTPKAMSWANHYGAAPSEVEVAPGLSADVLSSVNVYNYATAHAAEKGYDLPALSAAHLQDMVVLLLDDYTPAISQSECPFFISEERISKFRTHTLSGCMAWWASQETEQAVPMALGLNGEAWCAKSGVSGGKVWYGYKNQLSGDFASLSCFADAQVPIHGGDSGKPVYIKYDGKDVVIAQWWMAYTGGGGGYGPYMPAALPVLMDLLAEHGQTPNAIPANGKVLFKTSASQASWSEEDADIADGTFNGFASKNSAVEVIIPSKDASGNDVTSIVAGAFKNCNSLTSVTIPNSVTSIGYDAFAYCSWLTSVTIPDGVTSIGSGAFSNCYGLTSVTIPASVTSIGDSAFETCNSLTRVNITDIPKWCSISFGDASANPLYYAHNLYLNGALIKDLTIPDSVTNIAAKAFSGCTGLTSVTIPDSVTSIGSGAFSDCYGLTSVTIGNNVEEISSDAFYNCTSVNDVYCWPNPANLTWNEGDKDDFKPDGSTVCHVKAEYLAAYQAKFGDEVNATFVGDLA